MDKYTALFKNVLSYPYAGWGDSVSRTKKNSKNILKVGNMMGNKKISLGKKSQQTDESLDYICYILKWINTSNTLKANGPFLWTTTYQKMMSLFP